MPAPHDDEMTMVGGDEVFSFFWGSPYCFAQVAPLTLSVCCSHHPEREIVRRKLCHIMPAVQPAGGIVGFLMFPFENTNRLDGPSRQTGALLKMLCQLAIPPSDVEPAR
jgi:hypothetical protein